MHTIGITKVLAVDFLPHLLQEHLFELRPSQAHFDTVSVVGLKTHCRELALLFRPPQRSESVVDDGQEFVRRTTRFDVLIDESKDVFNGRILDRHGVEHHLPAVECFDF